MSQSELAEAIKTKDWSDTPLGDRTDWSLSLKHSVNLMLSSAFPIAILWGPELILIYNDAYKFIAGNRHPDALGKSTYQVWPEVAHINKPIFDATMKRGETIYLENALFPISRNGKPIEPAWFTLSSSPIYDDKGKIQGTLVILIETTQKILADQQLKTDQQRIKCFVDDMPAAVALFDREMKLVYASKRYLKELRIIEPEPWGKSAFELIKEFQEYWQSAYIRCLDGHQESMNEQKIKWPDQTTVWIKWEMNPWLDDQGKIVGVLWSSVIINELKKLEEELRASLELRDEFMSIASHELKTPLTALNLQIQLIQKQIETIATQIDSNIVKLNKKTLNSVNAITRLVDDLMDVTRIRAGKLSIEFKEMDLKNAVIEAAQQVAEEALQKGSMISIKADQSVIGHWDPLRINQVLRNLLTNAIKYGDGKPIELRLNLDEDKSMAQIQVQDSGFGIPHDVQQAIFNRFERGKMGNGIAGLGLGLYIVKKIVLAHAGTIQVKSEPGKGSLFTVELPIHTVQTNQELIESSIHPTPTLHTRL